MKKNFVFIITALILAVGAAAQKQEVVQDVFPGYYEIHGLAADSGITALLQPYKRGVDTQMKVVAGHSDVPMTKSQPESTMGNFVADAQLAAAQQIDPSVAFAAANYGGLRIPYLSPGPITRGNIYELMPFDNFLTIVEMPGRTVQEFCDHMAMRKGWPVSGITYVIQDDKATGIKINGEPLNENITYKVAINDYMAEGGDNCDMLRPLRRRKTGLFIRDALLQYLNALEQAGMSLHPALQNRVTYAE